MSRPFKIKTIHYLGLLGTTLIYLLFAYPITSHAQAFLTENTGVTIISKPEFPSANTSVLVSLDDYSINTLGAKIAWYVNNIELTQFRNARSATVQTGDIGKKLTVQVALTRDNGLPLTAKLDIIPTKVDIVLEANTYVPTFYKGRRLPSSESEVRAIAVVHDGTQTPDTEYTYTWSRDETILLGGPVKGKNVLNFTMPHYDKERLTVEVFNTNGAIIGRHSIVLESSNPELHFYEQSPLRGLFHKEITTPFTLIGDETTIYGEPYYLNSKINDSSTKFSWEINGDDVQPDTLAPNALTLSHVGGGGSAEIGLEVLNETRIPQLVKKIFKIYFE